MRYLFLLCGVLFTGAIQGKAPAPVDLHSPDREVAAVLLPSPTPRPTPSPAEKPMAGEYGGMARITQVARDEEGKALTAMTTARVSARVEADGAITVLAAAPIAAGSDVPDANLVKFTFDEYGRYIVAGLTPPGGDESYKQIPATVAVKGSEVTVSFAYPPGWATQALTSTFPVSVYFQPRYTQSVLTLRLK